ncbi:uncharacterized protein B0P05DRAFT_561646 [Gilbertella persicaria]|nr:uncharacterized protein B0P05DRAFT_561646 [Gilbertella persicaria]KAI8053116.1 hypothetical protein B0P05DRAFT_561646 [Gilbertella persicaria]
MTRIVVLVCIVSCFFYFFEVAQAFNLKSMLFGDNDKDSQQGQATTVPFGTPIVHSQSRRSNIPCEHYICEETNVCVEKPLDCPCRIQTDKKCFIGDWYICIRGDESCDQVL